VDDAAEALFEEARRRARSRRRRRAAAVAGALLASGTVALIAFGGNGAVDRRAAPSPPVVSARSLLAKRVAIVALACPKPNSIACDRVAIRVVTRRPERSVTATIDGRSVVLDDPRWSGRRRHGLRRGFAGFLQPAGLRARVWAANPDDYYTGEHGVWVRLRLTITRPDRSRVATSLRLGLSPGWG
jgi:hypothetical protein